jgi:hypothetical protein
MASSRRKWYKRSIIIFILFAIIFSVGLFVKQFNGPSQGNVASVSSQKASAVTSFNLNPVLVTSPYVNFSYPKALSVVAPQVNQPPLLDTFIYGYRDTESWRLAITVNSLNGTSLNEDSSYQFRLSEPEEYKESHETVAGKNYVVMTDTQAAGFSEVAYIINGSHSADISLYGDDPTGLAYLQETFAMVLKSWHWN